jgi:hypothetical protein
MRFRSGMFYRHEKMMDVFIEVIKTYQVDNKRSKVKVRWWNYGYVGEPWSIGITQTLDIRDSIDWILAPKSRPENK